MNHKRVMEYLFYAMVITYFVGKIFEVFTVLIDLIFIAYLYKNRVVVNTLWKEYKPLIIAFAILYVYFIVQSFLALSPSAALKSSVGSIRFPIAVFAAIVVFDSFEKVKKLILASFIGIGIVGIDALYQAVMGVDIFGKPYMYNGARLTAWNDMPKININMGEFFGILLISPIIMKGKYRTISIFMLLFASLIFILSGNRSPILALLTSILIIGLFSKYRKMIFTVLIAFGIIFFVAFSTERMHNSLSVLITPPTKNTTSGRLPIYLVGLEMIKDNPLIGLGAKNFHQNFRTYYDQMDFKNKHSEYYRKKYDKFSPLHIHSVILDILVSYGIIGLLLFFYLFYQIYRTFVKNNEYGLIASIGFLYCITPLQFSRSFTQSEWQFITYLGLIFLAVISNYYKKSGDVQK